MQKKIMRWLLVLETCLAAGCSVGRGDGWITGSVRVGNCEEGRPLERKNDFDLGIDFFAAEPAEDSNPALPQRRNSLLIRVQNTSNNPEASDGMLLQFTDLTAAARAFSEGAPLPITRKALCTEPCAKAEDPLRARLYLFSTCPSCRDPLVAASLEMVSRADPPAGEEECLIPSGKTNPECPVLDEAQRQELQNLCAGDFKSRVAAEQIDRLLGGGACLYLCEFGRAARGQSADQFDGFRIDYGDRLAMLFSLNLVDARAVEFNTCAGASGQIRGMFTFTVERGRSVQSFP